MNDHLHSLVYFERGLEVIFFFTTRWGVGNKASVKCHFLSKSFRYSQISLFLTSLDIILLMPLFMAFMNFCLQLFIYPSSLPSSLLSNVQART